MKGLVSINCLGISMKTEEVCPVSSFLFGGFDPGFLEVYCMSHTFNSTLPTGFKKLH